MIEIHSCCAQGCWHLDRTFYNTLMGLLPVLDVRELSANHSQECECQLWKIKIGDCELEKDSLQRYHFLGYLKIYQRFTLRKI